MGIWDDIKDTLSDLNNFLKRQETVGEIYREGLEMAMRQSQTSNFSSIAGRYASATGTSLIPSLYDWATGDKEKLQSDLKKIAELLSDDINDITKAYDNKMEEVLMKYDDSMRNIATNTGLTTSNIANMKVGLEAAYRYAAELGVSFDKLISYQKEFNEELRISAPLLRREVELLARLETATGYDKFSKMAMDALKYGNSLQNIEKVSKGILESSSKTGVNLRNVLKNLDGTIKDAQKVNFQNGIEGLSRMVIQAEKLKFNINDAFSGIEKAKELEGAFEMATNLQMLGKNVDALELNYLANYDPQAYMEKMNELLNSIGAFNKRTGEMVYSAVDNKILTEISKTTGMTLENMKEQRAEQFRIAEIRRQNVALSEEEASFVSKMSRFEDGRFRLMDAQGQMLDAQRVSRKEIMALMETQAGLEDRAKASMGFEDKSKAASLMNEAMQMEMVDMELKMKNLQESISKGISGGIALGFSEENAKVISATITEALIVGTKKAESELAKTWKKATAFQKIVTEPMYEEMFGNKYQQRVEEQQPSGKGIMDTIGDWFSSTDFSGSFEGMAVNAGRGIKEGFMEATPELAKAIKSAVRDGISEGLAVSGNKPVVAKAPQASDSGLLDGLGGLFEGLRTRGYNIG